MEEQDFYQVLQVDPQASPEIIAEAYWLLTRKAQAERSTHNPTAGEALNRLNSAYATLVKPEMRRAYDSALPPHRLDGSSGDGAAHRSLPGWRRDATGAGTKDLYRILQVDPEAGREIIAAAYACLRQRYREGLWSGEDNEQALEDMAYAFSVLSDNDQRARYDQTHPIQPSGERKPGEQQTPPAAGRTEAPSNGPPAASAAFRRLASLIWLAAVTAARVTRYCAVRLYRGGRWLLITVVVPGARKSLKAVKATRAVRDGSPVGQDSGLLRKKHRPAIVRRTQGGQGKMESIYDLTPEVTAGAMPSTHTPHRTSRPPSVAVARVVVTAITGLFLYIGYRVGQEGSTTDIVVLLALLGAAAACTALAWWQATMGGLALVLLGVALAVFFIVVGGDDSLLLAGFFGAPYLLAGLMLFVGSVRSASA